MEGYSSCVYTALDEAPDIVPPPIEYDPPEEWTDFVNERSILEEEFKMLSTELFEAKLDVVRKYENIEKARANMDIFTDELRNEYLELLDKYEVGVGLADAMDKVRVLSGKHLKLKEILRVDPEQSLLCPICCERPVKRFLDPCGHTFCTPCIEKGTHQHKCPICRSNTREHKNLYYS